MHIICKAPYAMEMLWGSQAEGPRVAVRGTVLPIFHWSATIFFLIRTTNYCFNPIVCCILLIQGRRLMAEGL